MTGGKGGLVKLYHVKEGCKAELLNKDGELVTTMEVGKGNSLKGQSLEKSGGLSRFRRGILDKSRGGVMKPFDILLSVTFSNLFQLNVFLATPLLCRVVGRPSPKQQIYLLQSALFCLLEHEKYGGQRDQQVPCNKYKIELPTELPESLVGHLAPKGVY